MKSSGEGSNVVFSGAKLIGDIPYISDTDPILNQLPNGGVIVSIASSGGVGVAPLVGAKVIANIGAGGSITEIIGVSTVGTYVSITDFVYTPSTGIATVTTSSAHNLSIGGVVDFRDIEFDCTKGYDGLLGITTAVYNEAVGILTVTTSSAHNLNRDMLVRLANLEFGCADYTLELPQQSSQMVLMEESSILS